MRYLIPVVAVMAVVMTGETSGWAKNYQSADSYFDASDRQQVRGGRMPTSGFRVAQLSN
jgi:hypothetical protein